MPGRCSTVLLLISTLVLALVSDALGQARAPLTSLPDGPNATFTQELAIPAANLGIHLVNQPGSRAPAGRLIATGPSPREIRARILANINAADTTNADQLWSGGGLGLNLTGTGLTVGIWDGGSILSTHQELAGRVSVMDPVGLSSHATHVAGTIGATGVNPLARGMAGAILFRSRDFFDDLTEMTSDAALINMSNHSYSFVRGWTRAIDWGIGSVDTWFADRSVDSIEDSEFGKYEVDTQSLDQLLSDNPNLLSVWAAANDRGESYINAHATNEYMTYLTSDPGGVGFTTPGFYLVPNAGVTSAPPADGNAGTGFDCLPNMQVSKNSLVVGAVFDVTNDPYALGDVTLAGFSDTGPTDDGRVKPDVVANGIGLTSSIATGNTDYASFSGTSMASPNACGTAALLVEHFRNRSGSLPTSATTKALLIHTAFDAGNIGPDYLYGWGLIDAASAARFLNDALSPFPNVHRLITATYSGSEQSIDVIASGAGSLKATLVWTDPPPAVLPGSGLDDATPVLVNDLDLRVVGPGGATTFYPWTLDPLNPSLAAVRTVRNAVDNVEQVRIDAPLPGTYSVKVSHTGAVTPQNYTLLVSVDRGCSTCPGDVDGNNIADGRDIRLFATCVAGGGTAGQRACSDMNADGLVNASDATLLVQRLVASPGLLACP